MTSWQLAVDLGTSFCCAAARHAGRVDVLEVNGARRVPSAVLLLESGALAAGTYAVNAAGRAPERYERNPKRYAGRPPMLLGGEPVSAARAFATLLELFLAEGRRAFDGAAPDALVLTHPVSWAQRRCDVLREAAAAVLPDAELTLVEEPVAASVHFATEHELRMGELVSVYDLGGGTFDCVALQASADGFSVVGPPGGDDEIGGERFDELLYEHFGLQLAAADPERWEALSAGTSREALRFRTDLMAEAQLAKEELSEYETAYRVVRGMNRDVTVTRDELAELVGAHIARTVDLLSSTLQRAGIDQGQLKSVFLTGGASRMPMVREAVSARFGDLTRTWADPKTVVALGAVRLAGRRAAVHSNASGSAAAQPSAADLVPAPAAEPEPPPASDAETAGEVPGTGGNPTAPIPRPVPLQPPASQPGDPRPVLSDVYEAAVVGDRLFAWCAFAATGSHVLVRLDARSGAIDRQLPLPDVLGWAVGKHGLLVAARDGSDIVVMVISPELAIRTTRVVRCQGPPTLFVNGAAGFVSYDLRWPMPVDNSMGLPWGAISTQALLRIDLESLIPQDDPYPLGSSMYWYINEDGQRRRLLAATGAGGWPTAPLGDGGCAIIRGHFDSQLGKRPFRSTEQGGGRRPWEMLRKRRHEAVVPWQLLELVPPAGPGSQLERRSGPWWTQVLRADDVWYSTTTAGLCLDGVAEDATVLWELPPAGAARWCPGGDGVMYAVAVDQLLPTRGLRLWTSNGSTLEPLLEAADLAPVGHVTAPASVERLRVQSDAAGLLVPAAPIDGDPATHVHLLSEGKLAGSLHARGRLEPVGRSGAHLWCLHSPDADPHAPRVAGADLVRLPLG